MLACCSGLDILLILAAIFFGGTGLLFFTYWPYRAALKHLAASGRLSGKPFTLFGAAFGGACIWIGGTWLGLAGVLRMTNERSATFWLIAVLGIVGSVGWVLLLIMWLATRRRKTQPSETVPPLQVWFQDLIVAMLCYGAGLTIAGAMNDFNRTRAEEFLPLAIYLLMAGSFGLFVALDIARRSPWGKEGVKRALMFVMIFTVFPVTLPIAMLAYWRWRRALKYAAP